MSDYPRCKVWTDDTDIETELDLYATGLKVRVEQLQKLGIEAVRHAEIQDAQRRKFIDDLVREYKDQ